MPKFLENALRHEGRKKGLSGKHLEHYVYGGMNNIGAMHGSKETAKGREMEKKHMAKEPKHELHHIEIHPAENGGHTVEHHYKPTSTKSGAFMERPEPEIHVFGKSEHNKMISHLKEHLGIGAAKASGTQEESLEPRPHEPPHEKDEVEEELSEGE